MRMVWQWLQINLQRSHITPALPQTLQVTMSLAGALPRRSASGTGSPSADDGSG